MQLRNLLGFAPLIKPGRKEIYTGGGRRTHAIRKVCVRTVGVKTAVDIRFEPGSTSTQADVGEILLDVAVREKQIESKSQAFCRDGGCFLCEMEVDTGNGEQLLRTCQFKIPAVKEVIVTRYVSPTIQVHGLIPRRYVGLRLDISTSTYVQD